MDIDRLIVEYPNAMPDKVCSHVIEYHEELESQGETHKGTFGYTDKFDNKIKNDTESVFDNCEKYALDVELLADTLHNLIEKYYSDFDEEHAPDILEGEEPFNPHRHYLVHWMRNLSKFQIQKYKQEEGGYPKWHVDQSGIDTADPSKSDRILAWMLYCNTVEDGGETEFYYLNKKVKPEKGKIVIFPADFPFVHRGNVPIDAHKYIVTGWYRWNTLKQSYDKVMKDHFDLLVETNPEIKNMEIAGGGNTVYVGDEVGTSIPTQSNDETVFVGDEVGQGRLLYKQVM